jgi:hypothetical protein
LANIVTLFRIQSYAFTHTHPYTHTHTHTHARARIHTHSHAYTRVSHTRTHTHTHTHTPVALLPLVVRLKTNRPPLDTDLLQPHSASATNTRGRASETHATLRGLCANYKNIHTYTHAHIHTHAHTHTHTHTKTFCISNENPRWVMFEHIQYSKQSRNMYGNLFAMNA